MATLYVAEFQSVGGTGNFVTQAAQTPADAEYTVAIGAVSAQSQAFGANTRFIRVHTDAICSITFGANPTATTSKPRLAAGNTEYFAVIPGQKLAVITNT